MSNGLVNNLTGILKALGINSNLSNLIGGEIKTSLNQTLISLADNKIVFPLGNVQEMLGGESNNLSDQPIDFEKLDELINDLSLNNSIVRLSHLGFCYKTISAQDEKIRLSEATKKTALHLYEEPSNDEGMWLFLGDVKIWKDPTIEFVLIEKTTDPDKEYWLPHIQIDIDTTLSANEIISEIAKIYGSEMKPFSIVINGITYIERCRLGRVGGVNIFLDLATNSRNVNDLKNNIWKQIV